MPRRALLVPLLALLGCAGRPIQDPEPPGASDREPTPAPAPTAVDAAAQRQHPGMVGFWCADFYPEPGAKDYLGECYRTRSTCEFNREGATKAGQVVTECREMNRALCFEMWQVERHQMNWRCYTSEYRCSVEREKFREEHGEKLLYGECELTAEVHRAGRVRTAGGLRRANQKTAS